VLNRDKAHAIYEKAMKALKIDIEQLQKAMEKMKCVELYYFKHQLYEYDELKMQYMMLWIK
jgi:hypothetical protein